jgi:3',5'-cyclic AMP phosphodiesterase CpdA
MTRTYHAGLLVLIAACQAAIIRIERSTSGTIVHDLELSPRLGKDGHYISLPDEPYVNCIDILQAEIGPHEQLDAQFCASSGLVAGFLGYRASPRVPWLSASAELAAVDARDALAVYGGGAEPEPVLSFLHVSDVQVRESRATLGGSALSHTLDTVIGTFERDHEQELYSAIMYGAIVETVNAELGLPPDLDRPPPRLMIHTGDAVDSGLASELDQFHAYSDRLQIPWYQAIGNHDVLAFGNLTLRASRDDDEFTGDRCAIGSGRCTCTRIGDLVRELMLVDREPDNCGAPTPLNSAAALAQIPLQRICLDYGVNDDRLVMEPGADLDSIHAFMAAHREPVDRDGTPRRHGIAPDRIRDDYASMPAASMPAASMPAADMPCAIIAGDRPSALHGFDLIAGADTPATRTGYYCFQMVARGRSTPSVWAIVLNTSNDVGAYGSVSADELAWLKTVVANTTQIQRDDLILAFGHHPLYDIYDASVQAELVEALGSDRRMVGYFAGHLHWPGARVVHPEDDHAGAHHFWEILAPAVLTYPQQARQVTVKKMGDLGYFEILSFAPNGEGASMRDLERARAGAERDYCHGRCTGEHPLPPPRSATYARLFFRWPGARGAPDRVALDALYPGPKRASACPRVPDLAPR